MKPTLFRSIALVFTISVGLMVSQLRANHDVPDYLIPPVENLSNNEVSACWLIRYLVISVPNDDEYYLGKQRLQLSELSPLITERVKSVPSNQRVLYIKSGSAVRFESLAKVIEGAKLAGIDRVELVLDKRKSPGMSH
ncbi:MAG TPA: biopolymer transporter ExbD [Pyrinomonadaceae bacterium]|jgi:biopolymer transport protein ExbD|nr:biopolymer transporter ExbD [Pyrinomonadaceae bacterium]